MRLIDADALKEIIENSYEVTWDHDYNGGFKDACVLILDEIDSAPTIEPERKMGEWILITDNNGQHFICNKCGTWRCHQGQAFCSHCGADMRGAEK